MEKNFKMKYKIGAYLLSLTVAEYKLALHLIPKILGISLNTLHNYRNIARDAKQDIPYTIVVKFELLFEMDPGTLFNGEIKQLPLKSLLKRDGLPKMNKNLRNKS